MAGIENLRKYGDPPFLAAVIHGGPGAAGSMAPVARELSSVCGILEPLQASAAIGGEVEELREALETYGHLPVILIGHSWGAWLSLIFASRYPALVKKLILVGCGPLQERYASGIMATRLGRLSEEERRDAYDLMNAMNSPEARDKNAMFARFGALMSKADLFDPLPEADDKSSPELREDVFRGVWAEAEALRRSGKLLEQGKQVRCPAIAIHGDYDPHPAAGVERPLRPVIKDFRLILLKNCGHEPWKERAAKDRFYEILKEELR